MAVFSINETNNPGHSEIVLTNMSSGESISVIPEYGARLNSVNLLDNGRLTSVVRELNSFNFSNNDDLFNNAKLFPFANRISNGSYKFGQNEFSLPMNYPEENNACHGFIYDAKFIPGKFTSTADYGELQFLHEHKENRQGYANHFEIVLTYRLTDNSELICRTEVRNISDTDMLFTDGWHPYFFLENGIDNYTLKLDVDEAILTDKKGIPTGTTVKVKENIYELKNRNYDNLYLLKERDKAITEIIGKNNDVCLTIWQEAKNEKYKYIMVYTPPDRSYIALEPMTSNIDAFNNQRDLLILKPHAVWEASWGLSFKLNTDKKW